MMRWALVMVLAGGWAFWALVDNGYGKYEPQRVGTFDERTACEMVRADLSMYSVPVTRCVKVR